MFKHKNLMVLTCHKYNIYSHVNSEMLMILLSGHFQH